MVKKAQEEDPQEETSSRGIYATYIVRQQFKICTSHYNKAVHFRCGRGEPEEEEVEFCISKICKLFDHYLCFVCKAVMFVVSFVDCAG